VVDLPLWKIWKSDWIIIPTIGENKIHVRNHQPVRNNLSCQIIGYSVPNFDHFSDPTERIRHLHPSYPKIQATIGWRIQLRQILRKLVRAAPGLGSVTNDLPDGLKWRENEGNMCKKWSKWHIFPTEWMVWNTHVLSNSIGQAGPPAVDPLWQQNRQRHGDSPFQVWIPPMIPGGDRLKRM